MRVEVTLEPRVVGGVEPEEERLLPRLNTDEASAAMTPPLTPSSTVTNFVSMLDFFR
jgi:hypothetical protein